MLAGAAPDRAASGPDGKLSRSFLFNTYSGWSFFRGDRCDAKVRTLEVIVMHREYRARRVVLKKVRISSAAGDDVARIVIPRVLIDPIQP